MVINHNMSALYASRMEGINGSAIQQNMEKLSSGEKINSAKDDASGLAVSEKMRSQIRGLNQANRNAQNGISFLNTAEGFLEETTDILQRIRELAVQSSDGIWDEESRVAIQTEVSQLVAEVDRIASQAQFAGLSLLTGAFAKEGPKTMQFHIGPDQDQNISVYIGTMTATSLGLKGISNNDEIISLADPESANSAIGTVDEALKKVSKQRSDLGSYSRRLESASKGIAVASENITAAESRIRDTDMIEELVDYSKNAILQNVSLALVSQANSNNQEVLALLR